MPSSKTRPKNSAEYPLDNIAHVGEWVYGYNGSNMLLPRLMQQMLSSNFSKKIQSYSASGILIKDITLLIAELEASGGKCVMQTEDTGWLFAWDDSYCDLAFGKKDKGVSMSGWTLDPAKLAFFKQIETDYVSKVKTNLVFSIIKNTHGLEIKSLGNGHSPLQVDNYLPEVLEDLDYVVSSFKREPPAGRILILNGEPGTGKTHLIRSMLSQLDCVFLIIPSNLIDSLDKPEFVPLLISVKEKHEKSIIMIIEDGDACLVPRRSDNVSTIAALLNLSDGIVGSLIDIKIVISTNVYINEVDQAILRPGRLCKQIHVGPLPFEQANRVYQRLMNDSGVTLEDKRRSYTLAEIYDKFNTRDSEPVVHHKFTSKRAIGFNAAATNPDRTMNSANTSKVGFHSDK